MLKAELEQRYNDALDLVNKLSKENVRLEKENKSLAEDSDRYIKEVKISKQETERLKSDLRLMIDTYIQVVYPFKRDENINNINGYTETRIEDDNFRFLVALINKCEDLKDSSHYKINGRW